MNRRGFLKSVGLALLALSTLLAAKQSGGKITGPTVSDCKKLCELSHGVLTPVFVDGKKYYIMRLHPIQEYRLEVIEARDNYKHQRWLERYNRWSGKLDTKGVSS